MRKAGFDANCALDELAKMLASAPRAPGVIAIVNFNSVIAPRWDLGCFWGRRRSL